MFTVDQKVGKHIYVYEVYSYWDKEKKSPRQRRIPAGTAYEDLLAPIFRAGERVYETPHIRAIRERAAAQLAQFHAGIKRLANPHQYPVGLEKRLFDLKTDLILKARGVHS